MTTSKTVSYETEIVELGGTWANPRPARLGVTLYRLEHEQSVDGPDTMDTHTKTLIQTWNLPVEDENGQEKT